jgi:hypothetical protein
MLCDVLKKNIEHQHARMFVSIRVQSPQPVDEFQLNLRRIFVMAVFFILCLSLPKAFE